MGKSNNKTHTAFDVEPSVWLDKGEVMRGELCRIAGHRGKWKFLGVVTHPASRATWVNVIRPDLRGGVRSFDPDRVKWKR